MAWKSSDKALNGWRSQFHEVGVFVFNDAFQQDDYSGFCLYDDEFPVIYVNNSTTVNRQIFTLFHELAHLLFHTSGVDKFRDEYISRLHGDAKQIEILCNRLAATFLVPPEAFDYEFDGLQASRETAGQLAERFCVSREVIYRNFLERDLIDREEYERGAKEFAEYRREGGGGGGNYYLSQLSYLGPRYVGLAFSQYHANRIDERQLAEHLNIAPRSIGKMVNKIPGFKSQWVSGRQRVPAR